MPAAALAVADGGVLSDWFSWAFLRGSYSFSGCKVRERAQRPRTPPAGLWAGVDCARTTPSAEASLLNGALGGAGEPFPGVSPSAPAEGEEVWGWKGGHEGHPGLKRRGRDGGIEVVGSLGRTCVGEDA